MIKAGTRVETSNFGWAEATTDQYEIKGKASRGGLVDVRFDNTGNVRKAVYGAQFRQGCVRDGSVPIDLAVGQVYRTNNDGDVEVVSFKGKFVVVKFLNTGNEYTSQKDQMLIGLLKDRPAVQAASAERVARQTEAREQREEVARLRVEQEIARAERIVIAREQRRIRDEQWKLHSEALWLKRQADEVNRATRNLELIAEADIYRKIDNDLHKPTKGVLDIDFKDRDGKWVLRFKRGEEFIQTRLGKLHNNVTQRGKEDGSYQNKFHKGYLGVTVSELFSDPQKFCDWCVAQKGWGLGYQLDKDLLLEGNREYSEDACCFLPQAINVALYMRYKAVVSKKTGLYKAHATMYGEPVDLGNYESEDEAIEVCLEFKQRKMTKYANEYKDNISDAAYKRLTNA